MNINASMNRLLFPSFAVLRKSPFLSQNSHGQPHENARSEWMNQDQRSDFICFGGGFERPLNCRKSLVSRIGVCFDMSTRLCPTTSKGRIQHHVVSLSTQTRTTIVPSCPYKRGRRSGPNNGLDLHYFCCCWLCRFSGSSLAMNNSWARRTLLK